MTYENDPFAQDSAIAQDLDDAAALWVVRLERAETDEGDWLAFDTWLSASPEHPTAYDRALAVWCEVGAQAPALKALAPASNVTPFRRRAQPNRVWWSATAGVAAAAAVAAVFLVPHAAPDAPYVRYATAVGEHRTLTLEDGTRIDMNAGSHIAVKFEAGARRVVMDDAEAVFDVAKDPSRPFLITAGDRTVRVVGTEFDVRHRSGALAVTVRRGVVEVAPSARAAGVTARLTPGRRLDHREGALDSTVADVQPDDVFSWRTGRLIYRDRPLAEVVADLNANFPRQISLEDRRTSELRFSGVLVLDNEDAVVRRLSAFAPLASKASGGGVALRLEGRPQR